MSDTSSYITPWELNQYQGQRNAADIAYQRALNQIGYQRDIGVEDYNRTLARTGRTWDQAFRNVPTQLGRRGVLRSGIRDRAFGDYAYNRSQTFGDIDLNRTRAENALNRQAADAAMVRDFVIRQISADQSALNQQRLAETLRNLGLG